MSWLVAPLNRDAYNTLLNLVVNVLFEVFLNESSIKLLN